MHCGYLPENARRLRTYPDAPGYSTGASFPDVLLRWTPVEIDLLA
jgi:hypothetical protein